MLKRVYLSLGSNVSDRIANLRRALEQLPGEGVRVKRVSSLYRTEPVGFRAQAWFINCVAEAETELMPLQLLGSLERIERRMGRRAGPRFGPRRIDIDILLYENAVVRLAKLTIPHPRMPERRFVLIPLRELAAHLRHPTTRRTVIEMLAETRDASQVIRLKEIMNPLEDA
jgi:2-amino-4-hydroxy-6-hydroxymethyldihydropteridine diphosphokinase